MALFKAPVVFCNSSHVIVEKDTRTCSIKQQHVFTTFQEALVGGNNPNNNNNNQIILVPILKMQI